MNTRTEGLQGPLEWRDGDPGLKVLRFFCRVSGEKNSICLLPVVWFYFSVVLGSLTEHYAC